MIDGQLGLRNQLKEYQYRCHDLAHMSLLRFMLDTYDDVNQGSSRRIENQEDLVATGSKRKRGRPLHKRYPYKSEAKKGTTCRVERTENHETLPRFIGRWFPRSDSLQDRELYSASMLLLLKPWTDLKHLKGDNETFEQNFDTMMASAGRQTQLFVENAQYFYECMDNASTDEEELSRQSWQQDIDPGPPNNSNTAMGYEDDMNPLDYEDEAREDQDITEEDIERAQSAENNSRQMANAIAAIDDAYSVGIFDDNDFENIPISNARVATVDDMNNIATWDKILKETTRTMANNRGLVDLSAMGNVEPSIDIGIPETHKTRGEIEPRIHLDHNGADPQTVAQQRPLFAKLNKDQRRAHDIIEETLLKHMNG